jgi:hypothetical protein
MFALICQEKWGLVKGLALKNHSNPLFSTTEELFSSTEFIPVTADKVLFSNCWELRLR